MSDTTISILLPTRGRTEQLDKSVSSLLYLAAEPEKIQWLFGFDNDDTDSFTWFQENTLPKIENSGGLYSCLSFEPLGYIRLHEYVNKLASYATGEWFVFWNDDAVMQTHGWDTEIIKHTGTFCLQAFDTHKKHPYSIFPIVPKEWYEVIGHLSLHQLNDAWLSQIAWMLDIVKQIPVEVLHDRADLTGNNKDETFNKRIIFEGNVSDPRDFNYLARRKIRVEEANKIAKYLIEKGYSMDYWKSVCQNKVGIWDKMLASDVNKHLSNHIVSKGK
jgi:hypothetical protein